MKRRTVDHRNTCISIKIGAQTMYVFVPGHGRPGAPVSPPLSLWTDCLHHPLAAWVRGKRPGVQGLVMEVVPAGWHTRAPSASPGRASNKSHGQGAGLGPWCWAQGWGDCFLALLPTRWETPARLPCTLVGPPPTHANGGRREREEGRTEGRWGWPS